MSAATPSGLALTASLDEVEFRSGEARLPAKRAGGSVRLQPFDTHVGCSQPVVAGILHDTAERAAAIAADEIAELDRFMWSHSPASPQRFSNSSAKYPGKIRSPLPVRPAELAQDEYSWAPDAPPQ